LTLAPTILNILADGSVWAKFSDAVQGNLLTEAIVLTFVIIAVSAYYLKEKYESLQASKETLVAYRLAQHQRKEQTMRHFTDGIPTNLAFLFEIFQKRSYLRRMAPIKPDQREPYYDGRTFKETSIAHETDKRVWLTKVKHFTSICALASSRFDAPEIHSQVDQLREFFECLVELTPATPVLAELSGRLTKLVEGCPELHAHLGEIEAVRKAVLEQMEAGGASFDRTGGMRLARVIAAAIDTLFIRVTHLMSAELRHEPIQGLVDKRIAAKALKRERSLRATIEKSTTEAR
jgi:hypothetical protein